MNYKIFTQPLGMAGTMQKSMPIPLAVPLVMAGASIASSIWGGSKAAKAAEKARQAQEAEKARLESERRRKLNEDYIDTAAGQNMLRIAREEQQKNWKRTAGAAAVGGATDAAVAQAKDAGNKMVGDAIANIAAQDTARKDNIDASYRADISRLNEQIRNSDMAKAEGIAQAASGVSNGLMQGAAATFGGTKLGQSMMGTTGTQQVTETAPASAPAVQTAPSASGTVASTLYNEHVAGMTKPSTGNPFASAKSYAKYLWGGQDLYNQTRDSFYGLKRR